MLVSNYSPIAGLVGEYLQPPADPPTPPEPDLQEKIDSFQRLIRAVDLQVTRRLRPLEIQSLIDESFEKHVLAFKENDYRLTGQSDYFCEAICVSSSAAHYVFDPHGSTALQIADKLLAELPEDEENPPLEVFDIGTGNGAFLVSLKKKFGNRVKVTGLSASDMRTAYYAQNNIPKDQQLSDEEYIIGNVENIDKIPALKGRKFHWIVTSFCTIHLSDSLGTIARVYEFLKQGGLYTGDSFAITGVHAEQFRKCLTGYKLEKLDCDYQHVYRLHIRKTREHLDLPILYSPAKSLRYQYSNACQRSDKAKIVYELSKELSSGY